MFVSIPYRICIDLYSFVGCCCQVFEKMSKKKSAQKPESVRLFTVFIYPRLICLSRDCTAHVCLSVTTWHLSGIQREGNSSITWSSPLMPSFPPTCIECYFCYHADYIAVKDLYDTVIRSFHSASKLHDSRDHSTQKSAVLILIIQNASLTDGCFKFILISSSLQFVYTSVILMFYFAAWNLTLLHFRLFRDLDFEINKKLVFFAFCD